MEVVAGLINHIPLLLKVKPCGLSGFAVDKNREIKWQKVCMKMGFFGMK